MRIQLQVFNVHALASHAQNVLDWENASVKNIGSFMRQKRERIYSFLADMVTLSLIVGDASVQAPPRSAHAHFSCK